MVPPINLPISRPGCLYRSFLLRLLTDPSINKSPRGCSPVANLSADPQSARTRVSVAPLHGPANFCRVDESFWFPLRLTDGPRLSRPDQPTRGRKKIIHRGGTSSSQSSCRCECVCVASSASASLTLPLLNILLPPTAQVRRRHLLTDSGKTKLQFWSLQQLLLLRRSSSRRTSKCCFDSWGKWLVAADSCYRTLAV